MDGVDLETKRLCFDYVTGFFDLGVPIEEEFDNTFLWFYRACEKEKRRYLQQRKTPQKIKRIFIQDKVVTKFEAEQSKLRYIRDKYEENYREFLKGNVKQEDIKKIKNEYEYYSNPNKETITDQDIRNARERKISDFVEVKKGGIINCPFHNEKTPSMKITKNLFHCFGCNVGGDTITFIRKLNDLDFIKAVRYINSR